MKDCLFCKIIKNQVPSEQVFEDDNFIVIKNKFPIAPVHLLIIPKIHISKQDTLLGKNFDVWKSFFQVQKKVAEKLKISPNYQLLVNAPGWADFEHEHMHIIAGLEKPLG